MESGNVAPQLRFGGVFSGVGGMDLGLRNAGFQCVFQVEKDAYRREVLGIRFPESKKFSDISTFNREQFYGSIDLLCGGWPCQPFSLNGHRKASDDERDMWADFYRTICQTRPRWVVAENVAGVLSSENGRYFGRILWDLVSIGYDAEWDVLPAYAFGAPHKRDRLFLIAYPSEAGRERGLCGELQNVTATYPLWFTHSALGTVWDRLSSLEQRLGEPSVFGSNDGTPNRVDRLAAVGEAVIPAITEWIGKNILREEMRNNQSNCPLSPRRGQVISQNVQFEKRRNGRGYGHDLGIDPNAPSAHG